MTQTRILIAFLFACTTVLFSCGNNNTGSKNMPQSTVTDLQRDGLNGNIKQYTHEEYPALQQNDQWQPDSSHVWVRTVYSYDTMGTLREATDIVAGGKPANVQRLYKHANDGSLDILRYDLGQPLGHTTRRWNSPNNYTEKTYHSIDKDDTLHWDDIKEITVNTHNLPEQYKLQFKAGNNIVATGATIYYDSNNHISKKVLYMNTDTFEIHYTVLQQDAKGNPLVILKQTPSHNENVLMLEKYEYYK